jgi:hypothetical protein
MSTEHDRFEMDDAAYVLGSLGREETQAFEEHLMACAECRRSVAELSTLPGALAEVPADVVASLSDTGQPAAEAGPPDGLLEGLLRRSHEILDQAERRRRRVRVALVAAGTALAAAAAALVVALLPVGSTPTTPETTAPDETIALQPVGQPSAMSVDVAMTSVAWGTRMSVTCSYGSTTGLPDYQSSPSYALVVTDSSGDEQQVATWAAVPGRKVTVDAATAVPLDSIGELEVRTATGAALLSASP